MIRNWKADDIHNAGIHVNFAQNISAWIEQGYTNPDICFVWVENQLIKGIIAYAAERLEKIERTDIIDFSFSKDSLHLGIKLINQSLDIIAAKNVSFHLYDDGGAYADYMRCFIKAGFSISQEKLSYRFTKESVILRNEKKCTFRSDCRLLTSENFERTLEEVFAREYKGSVEKIEFRSYEEVGEAEFVRAIALVSQQTPDRIIARSVAKHGQTEAAELFITELKAIDFRPEIWMLAYLNDKLVGLIILADFGNEFGAINYIGIVPEERGKGYVYALLYKATKSLMDRGAIITIADIDTLNLPLKYALERFGYNFSCNELVLEKTL